ncbi:MAG TPA: DUF4118 domain-containing protein [Steroidobacteraceae bacterium]|nr:DUF4118 domain-containing protein [Steroidobacteraceae bacterium]
MVRQIPLPKSYWAAMFIVAFATAINWILANWLTLTDLAMVFLLGVVVTAVYCDRRVSIACALASFAAFDFFFVPPVFTFRFGRSEYLLTGLMLLVVGLVISAMAARVRREAEAATHASIIAAEERLRNSILTSISHDLRTPLAVIAGSASSLRENRTRLTEAEQGDLLNAIFDQARVMSSEIANVLDVARLQAGGVALDRQWHPIEELVGAALERCKSRLASHVIEVELPADLPMIRVDGVLIEKFIVNLLENAAQYTPAGTRIVISAAHKGGTVQLSVRDYGNGLTQDAESLFKTFSRGAREAGPAGSGLGLTICRAIALLHGAEIQARAPEAPGAEFVLRLPYETPPTATEADA